ncbi:glycosyltransferase family 2 protein [Cetobacterium sp.]|uniref:glycosyltransferase family 2 protein n=1 Tax=Cetobacterium sp. TaxID=2071632 RepID=UPI003AEF9FC8
MNELVSIIMPTYKRSFFIERALKSLVNQTYKNIEIIVIDDNSEYIEERIKTREILNKYSEDSRIVRIENKTNLGGSLSRNEGIKVAKGQYITFLDDDDEYELNKIEKQYFFYKNKFGNNKGFIYCQIALYDKNNQRISSSKVYIDGNKNLLKAFMYGGQANTPSLFIDKNILLDVEGFEKLYCGQEWYLVLKILLKGYEVYHMKDELTKYYEHNEERITTNYFKKYEGEKKLYEIKKLHIPKFSKEDQKKNAL